MTTFLLVSHLFNSQERNVLNYVNDILANLFFFFFLFFHFYYPVLGTGGGKKKHTETTTSPFLSQLLIHIYKMFMQTIEVHCPKATGAHTTDTKRSIKISGQKK